MRFTNIDYTFISFEFFSWIINEFYDVHYLLIVPMTLINRKTRRIMKKSYTDWLVVTESEENVSCHYSSVVSAFKL
jgi:hypothetical protein